MKRKKCSSLLIFLILSGELLIFTSCGKNANSEEPVMDVPEVVSQSVTDIYSDGATLKATIKTSGLPTTITFEYGPSPIYENTVSSVPDPTLNTETNVKAIITSLTKGTLYQYRVKAVNQVGTAYGDIMTFTAKFGVGQAYGGGFIIYLDNSGEHGLIAADTDQTAGTMWDNGTSCKKTNVTATTVGSGQANTARLVSILGWNLGNYPAKICDDLVLNGYSDWFLPSLQELDCMKKSLSVFERKYNLNGQFYWTSSEVIESGSSQSCYAWVQSILTGEQRHWDKDNNTPYVRAIRSF